MSETLTVRGAEIDLAADRWAPEGERRGVVILLHGGGQTRHSWSSTSPLLGRLGWEVLSLDARGHGNSDRAPGSIYTFDGFLDDLRAVVGSLGEKPVLVGASLGGLTALVAEGENAPFARALVLVDVVPKLEPDGTQRIRDFMESTSKGFDSVDDAAVAVRAYNPRRAVPNSTRGLERNLRRRDDGRLVWHWDPGFLNMAPQDDNGVHLQERARAAASRIRVPTLVLRGSDSDVVSDEGVREFQKLVRGAQTAVVAGTGHMVAGDDNNAFTQQVTGFLNDL